MAVASCQLPVLSSQLRVGDVPALTIDQSVELSIICRMRREEVEQESN